MTVKEFLENFSLNITLHKSFRSNPRFTLFIQITMEENDGFRTFIFFDKEHFKKGKSFNEQVIESIKRLRSYPYDPYYSTLDMIVNTWELIQEEENNLSLNIVVKDIY